MAHTHTPHNRSSETSPRTHPLFPETTVFPHVHLRPIRLGSLPEREGLPSPPTAVPIGVGVITAMGNDHATGKQRQSHQDDQGLPAISIRSPNVLKHKCPPPTARFSTSTTRHQPPLANPASSIAKSAGLCKSRPVKPAGTLFHLGLIFLKYISDRFAQRHAEILAEGDGADPEDRDEYTAEGVFWVPLSGRWTVVQAAAKQTDIGCYVFRYLSKREAFYPTVIQGGLENGFL